MLAKLKNNRYLQILHLFRSIGGKDAKGTEKEYPEVIQLPITYHCNSKCVMCNIWQMDWSNEYELEEFSKMMKDPLFKHVKAVGINGGEPTLVKNLDLYAEEVLKLPEIKYLNMISHGFNTKQLLPALEKIYAACKKRGVKFDLIISLDGYGEIHNKVRGLKVFKIVEKNIIEIQNNMSKYCDSFQVACTVVNQNVDYMNELDVFCRMNNITIKYRLGIENKRIESNLLMDQFSLLHNKAEQSAKEFFHKLYNKATNFYEKFKYFAIFYFMHNGNQGRLMGCSYKNKGVTMDSRGDLYYCAVESDKIGSLREGKGEDIFFDEKNIAYRKSIVDNKCNTCIHDYRGKTSHANLLKFIREIYYEKFFSKIYRLKLKFS